MNFVGGGIIGQRWAEWGGANGPFGAAIGPEEDVSGHSGRRQAFERGEIAWSPDEDMVVSVFRLWSDALFEWSHPHRDHDFFRYDIAFRAAGQDAWVSQGLDVAELRVEGQQQMWVRLQGFGDFAFTIRSCDGDDCSAFTVPVIAHLEPYTETRDPGNHPAVGGLIAERWHELGAWDGPLGLPITPEGSNNGIASQRFEHGSITTAPEFGPRMVVAACQRHNSVEVTWGGADTAYNAFRVDAYLSGRFIHQQFVFQTGGTDWALPFIGSGSVIFNDLGRTGGEGGYFFFVFPVVADFFANPATPGLFPDSAPTADAPPAGATPPVRVIYKNDDSDVRLDYPALDGTPAHAFASHKTRADAIARHYASMRPLGFRMPQPDTDDPKMTENVTLQLIAHLHAMSKDPGFRTPRDLPSRFLVPVRLRQRRVGKVGTKNDYDMALKGLMVIAYRYRALLATSDIDYILEDLVPEDLTGGHDFGIETYMTLPISPPIGPGPIVIPETENHLLMIESSRYLVNQLLHDRTGDEKYNNTTNGLKNWLLIFIQLIACFDFMEFNARPYQRLALHAILNLHEFARDVKIREAAAIVLDYTAMKFAVSSNRCRRVSPFRRLQERINHPDTEFNDLMAPRGDQVAGFFSMYLGPVDRDFHPMTIYYNGWTDNAVIAGLAAYRPPPAAYIAARSRHAPAQHVFFHGRRPRWHGSDDDAGPGVEIYYSAPSFLLGAGGSFLNSGYGHDDIDVVVDAWAQTSRAQAITLIPTRADPWFADLIRFDPFPDPPDKPDEDNPIRGDAVNMGVNGGLACGANLQVPRLWLDQTGATWDGPWLFLDLNKNLPDLGPLGFYVAIYSTTMAPSADVDPVPDSLAVLYAMEADASEFGGLAMSFADFERLTRERNSFPAQFGFGAIRSFHTPDDHKYTFWLQPSLVKYRPRVIDQDHPVDDFGSLNLVDGPYLRSSGHEGRLEICGPGQDWPSSLVLDYQQPLNPIRTDNADAWPQPFLDRARALIDFAEHLRTLTPPRLDDAMDTLRGFDPPAAIAAEYTIFLAELLHQRIAQLIAEGNIALADVMRAARDLAKLTDQLTSLGQQSAAVDAAQAAAEILGAMAPPVPPDTGFLGLRAGVLHTLALRLIAAGRTPEAVAPASLAAAAYRALADAPGADKIGIAGSLLALCDQIAPAQQQSAAVDAAQAAAEILGAMAPPVPPDTGFLGLRAGVLHTLALRLIAAGRTPEAVAPASLAAAAYRALADAPGADKIGIAGSLLALCDQIAPAQQQSAAVDAAQAAAEILGAMAPPVPPDTGFLGLRAGVLHTLALRLIAAGRTPEAVAPASLAVAAYVSLAAVSADVHPVIVSLQNLSQALASAGLDSAALDAQQTAMRLAAG